MDISLTSSGFFLPMLIIGIVIIGVLAGLLIRRRANKIPSWGGETEIPRRTPRHALDYQPELKPVPVIRSTATPSPPSPVAEFPKQKEIELTVTRKNLTDSLVALGEKYSLDNFTIATADGLTFGSSVGNASQQDAAIYSEIFTNDPLVETPGVILFGFTYKGSDLIGIIRTQYLLPDDIVEHIIEDTKNILNWWI